ncbi:phospholipase carboxylesterase [Cordyceps militaris]|uniref:Phospholipase carboxylesterase n=1 Tax=Cordyceps militaris TaxID=73501 RepID=A0A2H4SCC4_CORMI|nr:phospholipase carboxylesterase [Cordyceps militaris]
MSTTQYLVGGVVFASATLLAIAYRDYSAYCALGDHGLPGNFSGWCTQLRFTRNSRKDTTVPAPYDLATAAAAAGPHSAEAFLPAHLPARDGARPKIPGFTAPQRQVTDMASAAMKERMYGYLEALTRANPALLQYELSTLEGPVPALQLHRDQTRPKHLQRTRGEMAHIHPPDGSTHLSLSLADSRRIIETAWGQRHRLSGTMLGWGYTLVYAPRNEDEFQQWKDFVAAAAKYACADIGKVQLVV